MLLQLHDSGMSSARYPGLPDIPIEAFLRGSGQNIAALTASGLQYADIFLKTKTAVDAIKDNTDAFSISDMVKKEGFTDIGTDDVDAYFSEISGTMAASPLIYLKVIEGILKGVNVFFNQTLPAIQNISYNKTARQYINRNDFNVLQFNELTVEQLERQSAYITGLLVAASANKEKMTAQVMLQFLGVYGARISQIKNWERKRRNRVLYWIGGAFGLYLAPKIIRSFKNI